MTKGIPHLHEFLRKCIMRLTEAGLLIIGYLRISRRKLLMLGYFRRLLQGQTLPNRFRVRFFCTSFL
jgi:hypothetical protein